MKIPKLFKRDDRQYPCAPGRYNLAGDRLTTPHPVSDSDSYAAAQLALAVDALLPFNSHTECPKCHGTSFTTEHGTSYFIPNHPDHVVQYFRIEWGTYENGPSYLVRSCINCKYAWAEHTADGSPETPGVGEE